MNKFTCTLGAVCLAFTAISQTNSSPLVTQHALNLSLEGVAYSVSVPAGKRLLLDFTTGIGGGYEITESSFKYEWDFARPSLFAGAAGRWYYNREKMGKKGKPVRANAGNYIGMRTRFVTGTFVTANTVSGGDDNNNSLLFNLHWGLQRSIGKRWTFSFQTGAGWGLDTDGNWSTFYPAVDFRFRYIFNKKGRY